MRVAVPRVFENFAQAARWSEVNEFRLLEGAVDTQKNQGGLFIEIL